MMQEQLHSTPKVQMDSRTHTFMHDEADSCGAGLVGVIAGLKVSWLLALPALPGFVVQGLATLVFGALSLILNHYLKRWLERRKVQRSASDD